MLLFIRSFTLRTSDSFSCYIYSFSTCISLLVSVSFSLTKATFDQLRSLFQDWSNIFCNQEISFFLCFSCFSSSWQNHCWLKSEKFRLTWWIHRWNEEKWFLIRSKVCFRWKQKLFSMIELSHSLSNLFQFFF